MLTNRHWQSLTGLKNLMINNTVKQTISKSTISQKKLSLNLAFYIKTELFNKRFTMLSKCVLIFQLDC